MIAVQREGRDLVARLAAEGYPRQVALVAAGYLEELQTRADWSATHRDLLDP